jgi:hypothetical protein
MDQTTNEVNDAASSAEKNESADQIRADIEHTREEMSHTIDALQERLDPQRIKEKAREKMQQATVGRAEHFVQNTKKKVHEISEQISAAPTPQDKGAVLVDVIKRHPLPAALLGLGVLWISWNLLHDRSKD